MMARWIRAEIVPLRSVTIAEIRKTIAEWLKLGRKYHGTDQVLDHL